MKPGTYQCKVVAPVSGWFGEAGKNNTPFIRIPLVVTQDGPSEGDELTYQAWISDAAVERTVKNLAKVFGWDGDLEALAKLTNSGPFVGKACQVVCEEEEYNGETRVVIKWLNAVGAGGKSMDESQAAALARRLNAKAKAAASSSVEPF